jgi:hypothetical protein
MQEFDLPGLEATVPCAASALAACFGAIGIAMIGPDGGVGPRGRRQARHMERSR